MKFTILVIFLLKITYIITQEYVGDSCLTVTNESGQCKYFEECPSARASLMRGIPPKICGYDGPRSFVCCTGGPTVEAPVGGPPQATTTEKQMPKSVYPQSSSIRTKIDVSMVNRRISAQKCHEYAGYVYKIVPSNTFLPGDEDVKENHCGMLDVELIIGGVPAKLKEFPHMALIGYPNGKQIAWHCGGTLISDRYILTAGHCLYHRQFGAAAFIRMGDLNYSSSSDDDFVQQYTIVSAIPHPQYAPPAQYNDIALLKLNASVKFTPYVRPACLQESKDFTEKKAIASGWGATEFGGSGSEALMQVTLDLFSFAQCNKTYKPNMKMVNGLQDSSQLCAGSFTQEKDSCQGDSGGPLQIKSSGEYCMYNILGLVSFGKACGFVNVPGVYTRVSHYLDWIEGVTWPKS